eukprot:COSAG02_NODE_299_length_25349_cov_53.762020_10_plen_124_part_00
MFRLFGCLPVLLYCVHGYAFLPRSSLHNSHVSESNRCQRKRLQTVCRELRKRSSEKLKELYRRAKLQGGAAANSSNPDTGPSIMDDKYGETETSGTTTDSPAGEAVEASNAKAIARLEKKVSS